MQHYNKPYRNVGQETLDEETKISWNGPEIPHSDTLVEEALNDMFGAGKWHFMRGSELNKLKFHKVSTVIDNLQKSKSNFFLNKY